MASLDRMAFRGVRSFDEKGVAVVRFLTPLTVIQGANGSGKTTIIECLKYATTGDMPPNSKGGAFIHDPGMATTNEVKAQIRLRFRNTNKVFINCVRNVQVTRKRGGGLTMKTLESLLALDEGGINNRRTTLSTKCAELDQEVPQQLGVSRAILDNVIFCHQEENNWPLGEPSSLKKKFDEIFESARYQKAVDSLKNTRKDLATNNRIAQAELDGLKTDRQRAEGVKSKLEKIQDELSEKERRLKWLNEELEQIIHYNRELNDTAVRFRETVQKAEGLEDKKALYNETLESLKGSMTVLNESEPELQRRKDGFQTHLSGLKQKQTEAKRRIASLKADCKEEESLCNRKLSEKGSLESDKKHHERAVQNREDTLRRISAELSIKGYDSNGLSEEKVEDFIEQIEDDLRKLRKDYDSRQAEFNQKENEAAGKVQDLRSSLRAKESSREELQGNLKRLKERIKKVQGEIDEMPATDTDIESARKEHSDLEKRLQELNEELQAAGFDDKIRERNAEVRDLEEIREELTTELNALNRQADFRAKLDMNLKAAHDKQKEAEKLLDRHADVLERLIGRRPPSDTLEPDVLLVSNQREKSLTDLEHAQLESNNRVQRLQSTMSYSREQLDKKVNAASDLESRITSALEGEEFSSVEDAISSCQQEVDFAKKQLAMYESMTDFFENANRHSKEKKVCLGCNRGIAAGDLDAVEAYIADMIRKSKPAKQEEYRADLAGWQEQLEMFIELKPVAAQLESLKEQDIIKLKHETGSLENQLEEAKGDAEKCTEAVDESKAQMRELANLKRVASEVARLTSESTQLEKDAQTIENDLRSTGTVRTGDQVQQEIDGLADRIKRSKRDVSTLIQEKETKRTSIMSHERKVHQAEMAVAQRTQDHRNLLALQERAEEMRDEQGESHARLRRLEGDIEKASEPIQRATGELETIKREAAAQLASAQEKIREVTNHCKQLEDSRDAAQVYIKQRGPKKLKECEEALVSIRNRIDDMQKQTEAGEQEVQAMERDLNESRTTERNIADNLRFLQLQRDVKVVDEQLASMNLEDALLKHRQWDEKYTQSKQKENKLNGDAAHLMGEIASLKSQIKGRERELRDDYKNVEKRYIEKLIDVQTSKLAQQDLETYQKALQAAIMKYHSIKMEEINERLGELWRDTYQGSDVDTVMIRADDEGAGARSHNYRVVMVKDSVELDMRGRCSAGQKCLASILIRLALADSFSENCGIMALDEPTTNLDYDNILSLAESLAQLVKQRRQQSNFQLIVITHDDEFLDKLTRAVGLEEWLRVTRDDRNHSVIKRERHSPL